MIAKTTTGDSFDAALSYGAGLRAGRENKKAELLSVNNMVARDPQRMAAEMNAVAALSSRCKKPVLHTSLSWPPGEQVSREQMLKAAAMYCELMGAPLDQHQVVIYEHKDKPHPHLHLYINRVPLNGGPALHLSQNYARNVKACREISEQLGMAPVVSRRQSLKDHNQGRMQARTFVQEQLRAAMQDPRILSLASLTDRLQERGVEAVFKHDNKGILVGASFRHNNTPVKGTEVGYKAQQIREHFGLPAPAMRQTTGSLNLATSTATSARPAQPANSARAEDSGPTLASGSAAQAGVGPDDAERNENELKQKPRRRRRPKL